MIFKGFKKYQHPLIFYILLILLPALVCRDYRNWQLNDTIQSKIIALAFSMAAEIERDLISQRTKEALQFKKEQGMKLGRPKGVGKSKLDAFKPEIESLLANGSTQKFVAKRYNTTEANLHNWLKKNDLMTSRERFRS